jgi:UDP-N-acetylglucosamine 2-epimerase|tara:strand:+ start:671 stop:985 length:315 start_codon:yes stop_codon:yes gene_type:complete
MKVASLMVGNSSSAIIEAPSFKLPAINIGRRQDGREQGGNIVDVEHDRHEIVRAIMRGLSDKDFLAQVKKSGNPYGDGKTGPRIADILSQVEITPELIQKWAIV